VLDKEKKDNLNSTEAAIPILGTAFSAILFLHLSLWIGNYEASKMAH